MTVVLPCLSCSIVVRQPVGLFKITYTSFCFFGISLPKILIWSSLGSANEPSWVTTSLLTLTFPSLIHLSASRREAKPASAIIFCSRISILRRTKGGKTIGIYAGETSSSFSQISSEEGSVSVFANSI